MISLGFPDPGPFVVGDPYFPYAKSLLHFQGTDESTVFTDVLGHTWTAHGNAEIDTSDAKWGVSSGEFPGGSDWIDTPDSTDWTLGTNDFCVRGWVKFSSISGAQYICGQGTGTPSASSWLISKSNTHHISANCYSGSGSIGLTSSVAGVGTGPWYFISYCRKGSNFYVGLDGTVEAATPSSSSINDSAATLSIGRWGSWTLAYANVRVGDWEFLNGTAAGCDSGYTPPIAPFPDS